MPFKTLANRLQHLKELADLEQQFFKQFDSEKFYMSLLQYININFDINSTVPPTVESLRHIDGWVNNWLKTRLADSERWIVRAYVVGKLLEEAENLPKTFAVDVSKLPDSIAIAAANYNLAPTEVRALEWAKAHGGENVTNMGTGTAQIIRKNLLQTIEQQAGYGFFQRKMENEILKTAGDVNRMWRRVAITEVNSAYNNGYLLQLNDKTFVTGYSLPDACDHCKKVIDGKTYLYVTNPPPSDYMKLDKRSTEYRLAMFLWENAVWAGKNNVGRSSSKYRRIDTDLGNAKDNLVLRSHDELWMPTIPLHPHDRCRWIRTNPESMWIDKKKMLRIRQEDPKAYEAWLAREITPKIKVYESLTKRKIKL